MTAALDANLANAQEAMMEEGLPRVDLVFLFPVWRYRRLLSYLANKRLLQIRRMSQHFGIFSSKQSNELVLI